MLVLTTVKSCVTLVAVLITIELVDSFDCKGREDGIYEASCQSAVICANSVARHLECTIPSVVNEDKLTCDDPLNVNTPCGVFRDCSALDDGGYPDMETQCHWYYVCAYGIFNNHFKCATDLVWNSVLQTCDFPRHVDPPCGTKQ